ncbi:MAG: hypothetical protein ABIS50_07025 [Luteolibacter sp.]|uniref:hypothetical protein n=1 Tax=Luteolibacter sp. TaxID=1962973 RepID=UPI00326790B1
MSDIPTPEEFEMASQAMRQKARCLDDVREGVKRRFGSPDPIREFFILSQRDVDFRAYIFFGRGEDLELAGKTGLQGKIVDFVFSELERLGRGSRDQIRMAFEFDSHENVEANFEGDYSLRLRS